MKKGDKVMCCLTKDNFKNNDFNCKMIVVKVNEDNTVNVKMQLWDDEVSVPVPVNYIRAGWITKTELAIVSFLTANEKSMFEFSDINEELNLGYKQTYNALQRLVNNKIVNTVWPGLNGGRKKSYYINVK